MEIKIFLKNYKKENREGVDSEGPKDAHACWYKIGLSKSTRLTQPYYHIKYRSKGRNEGVHGALC